MQTFRLFLALAGIVAVVALLIMKKDTKTVLIGVGLVLCVLCLKPLDGLTAFTSYMTKAGLIKAICASMGFAFVMKFTECDRALVNLLTRPPRQYRIFTDPARRGAYIFYQYRYPLRCGLLGCGRRYADPRDDGCRR